MTNIYGKLTGPCYNGLVRWNCNGMYLEVMDFNSQSSCPITVDVMMLSDATEVIQWAKEEMRKQKRLEGLRKKYSSLDEALKNVEIISALIDDEERIMPSMVP